MLAGAGAPSPSLRRGVAPRSWQAYPTGPRWRGSRSGGRRGREADGVYRFDRTRAHAGGLLHRHAAAHGQRVTARRARVLVHPHRHRRPVPPDARRRGVLPDGVGRQRASHRAPGPEPLRGPLRPVAALPGRLRRSRPARRPAAAGEPAQLHRAVPPPHRRRRGRLRGAVAAARAVGRLELTLRHHRRAVTAGRPAGLPPQPGPRRGLPAGGTGVVGRRLPDRRRPGRAGGPGAARAVHRIRFRRRRRIGRGRHHPTRAGGVVCRPGAPSRRRARFRGWSGARCGPRCSVWRCRSWPTASPSPSWAPGSPWCAPSATPPTWCGGASWTSPPGP